MAGIFNFFINIAVRLTYLASRKLTTLAIKGLGIFFPWLLKNLKQGAKIAGQKMQEHQAQQKQEYEEPASPQTAKPAPRPTPRSDSPPSPVPASPDTNTVTVENPTMLMLVTDIQTTGKTKAIFHLPPENHKLYTCNAREIWEKFDPETEPLKWIDTSQVSDMPLNLPPLAPKSDFISDTIQPLPPEDHQFYLHYQGKIERRAL